MSTVSPPSIDIDAPPEKVWKLIMDPARLNEWVTIHRKIYDADDGPVARGLRGGADAGLRGAQLQGALDADRVRRARASATWEGRGPARSYARMTNRLAPNGNGGTHFEYENEFKAPGGAMGRPRRACWWAACPSARPTSRSRSSRGCSRADDDPSTDPRAVDFDHR